VRRVLWLLLERLDDHPFDVCVGELAWLARAWLVVEAVEATAGEAPAPAPDGLRAAAEPGGDLLALLAVGRGQHDPAAQRQRLRRLRPPRPALEHLPLLVADHDIDTLRHNGLQSSLMTTTASPCRRRCLRINDSGH